MIVAAFAPVAIGGIDIVLLCAVIVLIGLAIAVQYTFQKFADAINVSIAGMHPLAGVARTIENTIVHWCAVGAKALENVANDLWYGLSWSVSKSLQALMAIPRDIYHTIQYIVQHLIIDTVNYALSSVNKSITVIDAKADELGRELTRDIVRLDAKIESTARAAATTLKHDITSAIDRVEKTVSAELHILRTTVETDIRQSISTAEGAGTAALDKLRSAEDAAVNRLRETETATADQLRELINNTPLTHLEGLLATVPALAVAVAVLEAETGLGRAECRSKIKNICATDPTQWAQLLEGIALLEFVIDPQEWIRAIVEFAKVSESFISDLVRA